MILDVETRHWVFQGGEGRVTHFADPASPVRQFCDRNFQRLLESQGVVLYSLVSRKNEQTEVNPVHSSEAAGEQTGAVGAVPITKS